MKAVIKLGGTLLDDPGTRAGLAAQLSAVAKRFTLLVVHGGGKQVTRFLDSQGVESRFVNGLRVSGIDVINAISSVIAGSINTQLVSALTAAGTVPVGLSGMDGGLVRAEQLHPDLGFVGRPVQSDPRLLNLLTEAGYLPVIACLAGDASGTVYNVNADQMAVSCAAAWQADHLIFLTDVPGVRGLNGEITPQLTPKECRELITSGVAQGGMQAKLEAALQGLAGGVRTLSIALGREPDVCERILSGERLGTRIVADR